RHPHHDAPGQYARQRRGRGILWTTAPDARILGITRMGKERGHDRRVKWQTSQMQKIRRNHPWQSAGPLDQLDRWTLGLLPRPLSARPCITQPGPMVQQIQRTRTKRYLEPASDDDPAFTARHCRRGPRTWKYLSLLRHS